MSNHLAETIGTRPRRSLLAVLLFVLVAGPQAGRVPVVKGLRSSHQVQVRDSRTRGGRRRAHRG